MKKQFIYGLVLGLAIFMMMGFTRDWDEANPTDSTTANQIDDYNRNLRVDVSDRLEDMVYGFKAGETALNQHFQYIEFYEQASVSQPSAGYGRLYTLAVGGKCELAWQDEDGDELLLTEGGKLLIGYGTAAQGYLWNTTEEDGDGGREGQIRATGEQSGGERSTLGYIEFSHDGTSDDQKGQFKVLVNDGDDDDAPSKTGMTINSDGTVAFAQAVTMSTASTLADSSQLATSAAPTADADIANKKYVDDLTKGNTPTANDSDSNAMLKSHAYLTQTSGFVSAYCNGTGETLIGYIDSDTDPVTGGITIGRSQTVSDDPFIYFFVPNGMYFEIVLATDTPTIYWTPLVSGGGAPIDQEAP